MTHIRIKPVEHKNDPDGLPFGLKPIGLKSDLLVFLIDIEVDEAILGKFTDALRVWFAILFRLLRFEDHLLSELVIHLTVVFVAFTVV